MGLGWSGVAWRGGWEDGVGWEGGGVCGGGAEKVGKVEVMRVGGANGAETGTEKELSEGESNFRDWRKKVNAESCYESGGYENWCMPCTKRCVWL